MVVDMLSERLVEGFNSQIGREFAAAHQYVAIGAWYTSATFPQLAAFFYRQAEEERGHAMKMVNYLLDRDAKVDFGTIEEPRKDFADHVAPIDLALDQEKKVTVDISALFEDAREVRDYQSEQFLHWFLEEQVEEESSITDLRAVAERTRQIPMLLEEYLARETPGAPSDA
jgi:ferritin